ncbi:L-threonylcarbamoyladenylate synthase [Marinicella litoralis]|uniref:Threonylcarbamoyl-AMP synthase n=1 Tax=Marinicella litoralis TaxID=644220 RepID=A0A4R6XZP4_9GAMM|nr:L-threonylcarbamoyladenylate synthase [Marinicella litoralis]TDR23787.1 L-threonylcarbamoyladenylate synthase [Marinicella litoralis]
MAEIGDSIEQAVLAINHGGTVVYPTEGVFGLGCDFRNEQSVHKILKLKQRSVDKGLVLIASHVQQILPLIQPENRSDLARALKTWPGHHTWIFPKSKSVPAWISGEFQTVAVRVSAHPAVKMLCDQLNSALVSTSANKSNQSTPSTIAEQTQLWGDAVDYYLDLPLGGSNQPSSIQLASNGSAIR